MDNRYFLVIGTDNDVYNFIELYDSKDKIRYHIDNGKIKTDYLISILLNFNTNKIPINKEKFNWILEQKLLIRNVNKEYLLKSLNLHEWII